MFSGSLLISFRVRTFGASICEAPVFCRGGDAGATLCYNSIPSGLLRASCKIETKMMRLVVCRRRTYAGDPDGFKFHVYGHISFFSFVDFISRTLASGVSVSVKRDTAAKRTWPPSLELLQEKSKKRKKTSTWSQAIHVASNTDADADAVLGIQSRGPLRRDSRTKAVGVVLFSFFLLRLAQSQKL